MPRAQRMDCPGSWHHVMNRGLARRTLFESRHDIRFFLACLAKAVRRGQIEIHAWSVLTTHFHLLVRSPVGELSHAMRRVQNAYVRRFNRGRKRDGPMVRGRFRSKLVTSHTYRSALVNYIDANPVRAGIVRNPCDYPYGSARDYMRPDGPAWLSRTWVEELVCHHLGLPQYDGGRYVEVFAGDCPQSASDLVERRMASPNHTRQSDPLDHLVAAAPESVRRWLCRNAELADGSRPGLAVADPASVQGVIAGERRGAADWTVYPNQKARNGWDLLEVGLLRDLTAAAFPEIGARTERTAVAATRLYGQHRELLLSELDYGAVAAAISRRTLARVHSSMSG